MEDDYDSDEFEQAVAAVEEEMENKIAAPKIEEEIETIVIRTGPDIEPLKASVHGLIGPTG